MSTIIQKQFSVTIPEGTSSRAIEASLVPITEEMNRTPLRVNKVTWETNQKVSRDLLDQMVSECREEVHDATFRPWARADCIEVFLNVRGYKVSRTTKGGEPGMDQEQLQQFANSGDKLAGLCILAREQRSKLSQLESWEPYANEGLVQAQWNQLGTPMGRYSCEAPNLQNRIVEIRETIEAGDGYSFLSLDLGQAEYVVWASLSKDPVLAAAFASGKDFHVQMWEEIKAMVPGIDLHEPDERKSGKTINFAILYLMQTNSLAKRLGCSIEEASALIEAWKARAPVAAAYIETYLAGVKKTEITTTFFGRQRHMEGMSKTKGRYQHELNKTAWHHHNSGTAAEILKYKQYKAWKALKTLSGEITMSLQMHDECIFRVPTPKLEQAENIATAEFNKGMKGFLPFKVDVRTGPTWRSISK